MDENLDSEINSSVYNVHEGPASDAVREDLYNTALNLMITQSKYQSKNGQKLVRF